MTDPLFGTSGIRGTANERITPGLALALAKSFSAVDEPSEVLIARDSRVSGKMLESALTSGFLSSGCKVRKLGIVPTPVLGFSISELGADAGVMITASHNPPEYNGLKFFDSQGMAISPSKEEKIEKNFQNGEFDPASWEKIGNVDRSEVIRHYLDHMTDQISLNESYKVIVGCACGPSSLTTPQLLSSLGCEVVTLNSQLDGKFPGRSPEPIAENVKDLCKMVEETEADLGFAHDGDGDRIAAVDEKGRFVSQDKLLALMGSYYVKRLGSGIVTTVDASKTVEEKVSEEEGEIKKTKVGDVSVAQGMFSQGFSFGGEPSGTWIMGDVHMCPDGTLAAGRILEMIESEDRSMSALTDSMSSYPILRDKVKCPDRKKSEKMRMIQERAPGEFEDVENTLTVDGIRLELEGGDWVLIRPSGTEPYIRVTSEAEDRKRAQSLLGKAKGLIEEP